MIKHINTNRYKVQVARQAVEYIQNGMVLGLGSGSTTQIAINLIGNKIQQGELKDIVAVPTSKATEIQARSVGILLKDLSNYTHLDLAIDGADEVDPQLNLIKGWGGALVREKLVEIYAQRFIIIVDQSKLVPQLGTRGPLPVEVTPFGWQAQAKWLSKVLACRVSLRKEGPVPYLTDNQNFILNCKFAEGIKDAYHIQQSLVGRPGIVGHGLFLDMATDVLIAGVDGIQHLTKQ